MDIIWLISQLIFWKIDIDFFCLQESGHIVFVFIYGTLCGGHQYSFRMYAFDLTRSRNFAKIWPIFQAVQGVGVVIGMPAMSNNLSGTCLIMASFTLILGERIKHYLRALKKHREHLERYHLQGDWLDILLEVHFSKI